MKKLTITALIVILLTGMIAFTACKPREAPIEGDTNITIEQTTPASTTPADTNTVIDDIVDGVQEVKEGVQNLAK